VSESLETLARKYKEESDRETKLGIADSIVEHLLNPLPISDLNVSKKQGSAGTPRSFASRLWRSDLKMDV
jgi:hypothetical protein